ncbi:alanine racemase [Arenibacter sp. ARW7G5Y1]|uniref:alanine racemase n=1 Tax=Arenibacter sp. ARW7G5Y1 TaxID=2135619 RepID=UPI000D76194B|nr:alanine racemase [Arenibacter sp. ARW7G5Y1]PXX31343.1 alanine racemase [Arenibacter sp. ARW7G5Y1]
MTKVGETVLEIDLRSLEHNYHYLRTKINQDTKFLGVVKAFAYGSDSIAIAKKLESLGADYLAVAYTSEGIALRNAGIELPILVLHAQEVSFTKMIENCLEPSLYSKSIFSSFLKIAKELGQRDYPVHLKFNTGLNRLGLGERDMDFIIRSLEGADQVKISSLFSHLAASEDINEKDFTRSQISQFEKISSAIISKLKYRPTRHMLNTSGIINYPEAQYDMVRSGIGLYGYGNEASEDEKLIPVATLKTIISQIHTIAPHESVGYNRAFISNTSKVTATLPLGHADGIGRQYGNRIGKVYIQGKPAPIIGNVCMDMIMVDITGIDCKEGDEVIVFGPDHSAENLASSAKTITYELLTGISQRVKRLYID